VESVSFSVYFGFFGIFGFFLENEAWEEQREIGWDQILKGQLSSKWGKAQELYYYQNAITRDSKLHSKQRWMTKTITSLLDFTLGLWNERCDALHGASKEENNKKKKLNVVEQVIHC